MTKFNKKKIYEEQIFDKINELKLLCNSEKIPMFFACAIESNDKKTIYETEYVGSKSNEIELKDDKITNLINVMNGFETIPSQKIIEIDYK